jgi:hypothetical protein
MLWNTVRIRSPVKGSFESDNEYKKVIFSFLSLSQNLNSHDFLLPILMDDKKIEKIFNVACFRFMKMDFPSFKSPIQTFVTYIS